MSISEKQCVSTRYTFCHFCTPIVIRFWVIAYFPVYIWSIFRVFTNNPVFARVKPPFKIYWQMIYNFLERATKKSCTPYKQIYFPFLYCDSVYVFLSNFKSVEWSPGIKWFIFLTRHFDLSRIWDILTVSWNVFFYITVICCKSFLSTFWTLICNNHYFIETFLDNHFW